MIVFHYLGAFEIRPYKRGLSWGDNLIVFHYLGAFEIRPYKRGGLSWRGETI